MARVNEGSQFYLPSTLFVHKWYYLPLLSSNRASSHLTQNSFFTPLGEKTEFAWRRLHWLSGLVCFSVAGEIQVVI